MKNIDLSCAQLGESLATIDEKLLTNALAVLQEQGLYAFFLFLEVRGNDGGKRVSMECARFLEETPEASPLFPSNKRSDVFQKLQALGDNLDDLLFARELLTQALVYARYHAKAKKENKS